ncbi:MAG: amidohydrolase family protein [Alphaproteobacteria bacterium]|nr:amidohydrolase family protein [Alphaproteobacteria bacterium]
MSADGGAPPCAPPDRTPHRPRLALPAGACDTHAHICGPAARYAYSPDRIYTPPDALLTDYRAMLEALRMERCVLVQPSVYGVDNAAMLDAMAALGPRCRGVAVVDGAVTKDELARLHEAGVRGVRLNLVDVRSPTGAVPLDDARALAARVAPMGWHVELLIHADDYPDFDVMFADFPADIVLGHLGYMRPGKGVDDPGFAALLRLLEGGRCWVKLTGPYRISAGDLPYADILPHARALADAAPDRILWGSDWPHVMVKKAMPNDGDLCDLLAGWIPDEGARERVLVHNPAALYGF